MADTLDAATVTTPESCRLGNVMVAVLSMKKRGS
jgi:hypothetical protein